MSIEVRPARVFDDVATMLGPTRSPDANRVRPGHRGRGITRHLVEGAVDLARDHGAPGVEAVPVDNGGERVDLTMAFVGTRALFESCGFTVVSETSSVTAGHPRVVVRRSLV